MALVEGRGISLVGLDEVLLIWCSRCHWNIWEQVLEMCCNRLNWIAIARAAV
jgi:hypothetical protein